MNGAFRSATYCELCSRCRDLAGADCRRCHTPLCAAHSPADGELCRDCERQYAHRFASSRSAYRIGGWIVFVAGVLAIIGVNRALGYSFATLPIVAISSLLVFSAVVWMLGMPADTVFRRKFIRASRRSPRL